MWELLTVVVSDNTYSLKLTTCTAPISCFSHQDSLVQCAVDSLHWLGGCLSVATYVLLSREILMNTTSPKWKTLIISEAYILNVRFEALMCYVLTKTMALIVSFFSPKPLGTSTSEMSIDIVYYHTALVSWTIAGRAISLPYFRKWLIIIRDASKILTAKDISLVTFILFISQSMTFLSQVLN